MALADYFLEVRSGIRRQGGGEVVRGLIWIGPSARISRSFLCRYALSADETAIAHCVSNAVSDAGHLSESENLRVLC